MNEMIRPVTKRTAEEHTQPTEHDRIIDRHGFPINPDSARILGTRGLILGKGGFWQWGPNATVDAVIIANDETINLPEPRVLTIVRKDNGLHAIPGGFIDPGEEAIDAVTREVQEEVGLTMTATPELLYRGHVRDDRETLNAWPETTAFLLAVDDVLKPRFGDDATTDGHPWKTQAEVEALQWHGSHHMLIKRGFERWYDLRSNQ